MKLTKEEQDTVNTINKNPHIIQIIHKYFIRPFDTFPPDYSTVPNEELGAQTKAQLVARNLNRGYLAELKSNKIVKGAIASPIVPE